uniref:AB hydrolase-1 domain-containing protein n=1 Tax=Rhizophora mucronata TaxID=61149 RepID=A0A2P2NH89_RHIMU
MAIITEEPEPEQPQQPQKAQKQTTSPTRRASKTQKPKPQVQNNPFTFWFYFTLSVSLITVSTIALSSLSSSSSSDPKSFFLSLSVPLRQYHSKGRTIKVQVAPNRPPTEIFSVESDSKISATEKVVIVHGLGLSSFAFKKVIDFLGSKGVHGVAFDLPGNGFSDKSMDVVEESGNGVVERLLDVYRLIKEKGIFWAFDNVIETGQIPYEEIQSHFNRQKTVVKPIVLGSEEMGRVLGQVIDTMGLAPVHLVLHDCSLVMVANWILENPQLVRSITLVDTSLRPALPLWSLGLPVVREIVLGFNFAYKRLISLCCSRGMDNLELEAHKVILKGMDGRKSVVAMEKSLNSSFDIAEWSGSDAIKGMPMQVIWSHSWSKQWSGEGRRVAEAVPRAKFVTHSSGRWPQDNATNELAEIIVEFIYSLPRSVRQAEEEPIPEHIQKLLDEAKEEGHHHHHHGHAGHDHHHHHGHSHMHAAGYTDAYGMGYGWGT